MQQMPNNMISEINKYIISYCIEIQFYSWSASMKKNSLPSGWKLSTPPRPIKRAASIQRTKVECRPLGMKQPKKQKNKSVEYPNRRRKVSLQIKTKYQISHDHMGMLMQQQKTADLNIIRSCVALQHYYQALMSLFGLIYSSSQIITANVFDSKKKSTGLSGVKFVGIIFSLYEYVWNQINAQKLRVMAKNVLKMGSTQRIFDEKIQFVCRRITLNYNNQRRIQMAFLNTKLDSYWKFLIDRLKFDDQIEILQDMYETAPQKMAYWDFSYFVNDYLADEEFYEVLKESNKNRLKQNQQDDTLPHSFTYEFVVIQIFCFHQEQMDRQQEYKNQRDKCQII